MTHSPLLCQEFFSEFTEIPEIQESTMQVPCGPFSVFDLTRHELSEFDRAVYVVINEHSHWDTGISHPLSYKRIAQLLNIKHHPQITRAVKSLIAAGFLKKHGTSQTTGANIYQVVHHNCAPEATPLDTDGRPQKCAVPRGQGSPTALCAAGVIAWREMMFWIVRKIHSDWTEGTSSMTVLEMRKQIRLSTKTICAIPRRLSELGLLERLSAKFRKTLFKLRPAPYPERKKRASYKGKRPLPVIGMWVYSYNKRWRFHKETHRLMMQEECGRWRDTNMAELFGINTQIHRDFNEYMQLYVSDDFKAFREALAKAMAATT